MGFFEQCIVFEFLYFEHFLKVFTGSNFEGRTLRYFFFAFGSLLVLSQFYVVYVSNSYLIHLRKKIDFFEKSPWTKH